MSNAPWLDEMVSRIGTKEIRGKAHNPVIVSWFAQIGHPEVHDDETSWCAVTVGSCLKSCGYPTTPVATNMLARSYLTYGKKSAPKPGALAIWPRGNSTWQGHINIVEKVREIDGKTQVQCVGGNQGGMSGGDAVTRSPWRDADGALGFRWPIAPTVKDLRKAGSTEIKNADTLETASAVATATGTAAAIVKEATSSAPDPTPLPSLIPDSAADHIGVFQTIMEAAHGLLGVVKASPWLAAIVVVSLAGAWLARLWKQGRLNRHILGLPLSVEADGGADA
ncbi:MAG: TIGR02594 family protein [Pirellulales bacterium]